MDIRRLPDGLTVWLEKGTDAAGLQHIYKRHEVDFVNKDILRDDIPNVVMNALEHGKDGFRHYLPFCGSLAKKNSILGVLKRYH